MAFMGPGMRGGMTFPGMQPMQAMGQPRSFNMAPPPTSDKRSSWSPSVSTEAKENQAGPTRTPGRNAPFLYPIFGICAAP